RLAERGLGIVTHPLGYIEHLGVGLQKLNGPAEAVTLKVRLRRRADPQLESDSEAGAGQVRFVRQGVDGPGVFGALMNLAEYASDRGVAQDGGQSVAAVGGRKDVVANGSKQEGF